MREPNFAAVFSLLVCLTLRRQPARHVGAEPRCHVMDAPIILPDGRRSPAVPARLALDQALASTGIVILVSKHVLLAAEARFLTAHLWNVSPAESVALLWRARRSGARTTLQALKLLSRNALPRRTYNLIRHWLTALTRLRPEHSTSAAIAQSNVPKDLNLKLAAND